jgi:hypothetical protein
VSGERRNAERCRETPIRRQVAEKQRNRPRPRLR